MLASDEKPYLRLASSRTLAVPKKIRTYLGQRRFLQDVRKLKLVHEVVPFDDAQKIGILYDATDARDYEVVKAYVKQVRSVYKKDIQAMGFVDKKQLPNGQFAQYGLDFFTRKDLDFRLIPKEPIVDNFIREPFDILINLNNGKSFPLRYIAAVSHAKFRIGRYDKRNITCYEMMLQLPPDTGIKTVIEETEHYLRQVKR